MGIVAAMNARSIGLPVAVEALSVKLSSLPQPATIRASMPTRTSRDFAGERARPIYDALSYMSVRSPQQR